MDGLTFELFSHNSDLEDAVTDKLHLDVWLVVWYIFTKMFFCPKHG